jgi:formylglycine-generating enzyme required for sulfatase activity
VGCVVPRSCNGLLTPCGPNGNCCHSIAVPGGEFLRTCDEACVYLCEPPPEGFPARVSPFSLDAFEVTVGRFRTFVDAYSSMPAAGSGKNPRNPEDMGWDPAWNTHLPATRDEFRELLASGCAGAATWTESAESNELLPITCVSWYWAQAFCIWDGGRLPTQAEWNFVAAGGPQERVYPWSIPPSNDLISPAHAVYETSGVSDVGQLPSGRGRWGHYDLAGNALEWVFDVYEDCYRTPGQCNDCGYTSPDVPTRTLRGGAYVDTADRVRVEVRFSNVDTTRYPDYGIRCARDL